MKNKLLSFINLIMTNSPIFICFLLYILKKYQLLCALVLVVIIVEIIKFASNALPKNSLLYKISRRPKNNANCGVFCYKNLATLNDPGLPSGHTTFITFFALCLPNTFHYNLLKILLIGLISFNRISTQCHTSLQVLSGIIFAYFMKLIM